MNWLVASVALLRVSWANPSALTYSNVEVNSTPLPSTYMEPPHRKFQDVNKKVIHVGGTIDILEKVIPLNEPFVLFLTSEWCNACPQSKLLAAELAQSDPRPVVRIDVNSGPGIRVSEIIELTKVPEIWTVNCLDGKLEGLKENAKRYRGPRTVDGIVARTSDEGEYTTCELKRDVRRLHEVELEEDEDVKRKEVVILRDTNFEKETQSSTGATTGDWLVMFHADWCGHCKRLAPVWAELASEMNGDIDNPVTVASVNAAGGSSLIQRFGVKGFPSIFLFSKGLMYPYKGQRSVSRLMEWLKEESYIGEGFGISVPMELSLTDKVKKLWADIKKPGLLLFEVGTWQKIWNTSPKVVVGLGVAISVNLGLGVKLLWDLYRDVQHRKLKEKKE